MLLILDTAGGDCSGNTIIARAWGGMTSEQANLKASDTDRGDCGGKKGNAKFSFSPA
jgi:hypothetical protein